MTPRATDDAASAARLLKLTTLSGSSTSCATIVRSETSTALSVRCVVNEAESPLGWLKSRKDRNGRPLITEDQYQAGERLRADYWFAHLSPRVTSNWSACAPAERSRRGGAVKPATLRDEVIAAKERVMRALMAVGPEVSGVLVDICCELKGLEEAEKENGWPQRAGKVVLADRLDPPAQALRPDRR